MGSEAPVGPPAFVLFGLLAPFLSARRAPPSRPSKTPRPTRRDRLPLRRDWRSPHRNSKPRIGTPKSRIGTPTSHRNLKPRWNSSLASEPANLASRKPTNPRRDPLSGLRRRRTVISPCACVVGAGRIRRRDGDSAAGMGAHVAMLFCPFATPADPPAGVAGGEASGARRARVSRGGPLGDGGRQLAGARCEWCQGGRW